MSMNNRRFLWVTQLTTIGLIAAVILIAKYYHLNRHLTGPQMIIIAACLLVLAACAFCLFTRRSFESIIENTNLKIKMTLFVLVIAGGLFVGIVHVTNAHFLNVSLPPQDQCDDLPKLQLHYVPK